MRALALTIIFTCTLSVTQAQWERQLEERWKRWEMEEKFLEEGSDEADNEINAFAGNATTMYPGTTVENTTTEAPTTQTTETTTIVSKTTTTTKPSSPPTTATSTSPAASSTKPTTSSSTRTTTTPPQVKSRETLDAQFHDSSVKWNPKFDDTRSDEFKKQAAIYEKNILSIYEVEEVTNFTVHSVTVYKLFKVTTSVQTSSGREIYLVDTLTTGVRFTATVDIHEGSEVSNETLKKVFTQGAKATEHQYSDFSGDVTPITTTSSPTTSNPKTPKKSSGSTEKLAIAAIVLAVLALVAMVVAIAGFIWRARSGSDSDAEISDFFDSAADDPKQEIVSV